MGCRVTPCLVCAFLRRPDAGLHQAWPSLSNYARHRVPPPDLDAPGLGWRRLSAGKV